MSSTAAHVDGSLKRIAIASVIGTTIEWYDLFLFATASALVFNKVFFPSFSPLIGTLLAFSTFASAYIARILGGAVFGHFGDRVGRRSMLLISLTLMGVSTFCIGLLPSFASVGAVAPILLLTLRVVQGLALGGEWGGAVLMAIEHAPGERRGLFGAWVQVGVPLGTLLANLIFLIMTTSLTGDAMLSWGWRIPFLISALLVAIGLYIRLNVSETPAFAAVQARQLQARVPLLDVFRQHGLQAILGSFVAMSTGTAFSLLIAFGLTYGTQSVGFARSAMLSIVLLSCALGVWAMVFFGKLSDRFGRKRVIMGGIIGEAVFAFPMFWLMDTHSFALALLGYFLMMLAFSAHYGPVSTFLAELFSTRLRYSGLSFSYMLSGLLGTAITPIVTTALLSMNNGRAASISLFMIFSALVSGVCLWAVKYKKPGASFQTGEDSTTP